MERLADDDEAALDLLIEEHAPALLRFASRALGGDRDGAEDVAQEVFIRVWKARRRWRPTASVRTFLFTIAARLCLNRRRSLARSPVSRPLPEAGCEDAACAHDGPDPERSAWARELGGALARELAALPANQRAALLLRTDAGLSYRAIAVALDTSAAAVESLLSRARARLRERLGGWLTEGNPPGRG